MIWRGHKTSLRDFRWPQLGPALFQLHANCLKTNFGRYIIDFCTPAIIIHNHLSFTCFDFLFACLLKYRVLYLPQLNFILRDEKHVTSVDQTPLTLVPSYKLSTKILILHILCKFNNMNSISFLPKKVNAILNRWNYIHSQKICFPQNSLSEWNETNYQITSKLLQIVMNVTQLTFPCWSQEDDGRLFQMSYWVLNMFLMRKSWKKTICIESVMAPPAQLFFLF